MALNHYQETFAFNSAGSVSVMGGASVMVRNESNQSLASLFSDRDGNVAIANPVTADANGFVSFFVADGSYRVSATLGGDTIDLRYIDLFQPSEGGGGDVSSLAASALYSDALAKIVAGTSVSIAMYGDSIFYGQDANGGGSPVNGSTQPRSPTPPPEALSQALGHCSIAGTVANRAVPGDTTADALTRWASNSGNTDISFIMYGHNDAQNYGGSGAVTLSNYRANLGQIIQREIDGGAAPILVTPTPVSASFGENASIRAYADAMQSIARSYNIICLDGGEIIRQVYPLHTDGVHLSPRAYQTLGYQLVALLANRGECVPVGDGIYKPRDMIAYSNVAYLASAATSSGIVDAYRLPGGGSLQLVVDLSSPLYPEVEFFTASAQADRPLSIEYSGQEVAVGNARHVGSSSVHGVQLPRIEAGRRVIRIVNNTAGNVDLTAFRFSSSPRAHISPGRFLKSDLSGIARPCRQLHNGDYWSAGDFGTELSPGGFRVIGTFLSPKTTQHGIAVWVGGQTDRDILTNQSFLLMRQGDDLQLRFLTVAPYSMLEDVATGLFADAGSLDLQFELVYDGTQASAYINGVNVGLSITQSVSTPMYPGIICSTLNPEETFICHSMIVDGVERYR